MELTSHKDLELIYEAPVTLIRSENDGQEFLEGYAVVFYDGTPGTEYKLPGGVIEHVMEEAFDNALATQQDIPLLYEHNSSHVIGSTATGTVTFRRDEKGIKFKAPVDREDPVHLNVLAKLRKHFIKGGSFQGDGTATKHRGKDGRFYSIVSKVKRIKDFSIVHNPAYKATTANISRAEIDLWEETYKRVQRSKEIMARHSK